jgi:TonB-dependent SusC/RagA subfamily outer membrane receptor
MKNIPFIVKLMVIAGCSSSVAYCQDGGKSSNAIIEKLTSFSTNHPAEKTYLQFDKPYYAAGDTIYFKAYVTAGQQHKLSSLSSVLHVDLINTKNKIDQSIKLQLDSGIAWGDFALPDSLPEGNYRVRAYTQWMRNNGDKDFFDRVVPVGSLKAKRIPEGLSKQPLPPNAKPDVQFFPEGGNMVIGIRSKMAFKAIDANGLGVEVNGTIVDNENRQVVSFASSHLGMGCFFINPEENKTYTAKITFPNGQEDVFGLPKPEAGGIVLSVDNDSVPKASVSIKANREYYQNNQHKNYTLLIQSGALVTTVNCKLDSPEIKLDILKRKLHSGVTTITLFSSDNEPLSERLIFIQNHDQLSLDLNTDKNTYSKREKVNIKLNALNRKGNGAEGHFSASVVDESKVPGSEGNGENMLTYLLLTSDVKGYIEKPDYYFDDTAAGANNDLDILMLTQGYRRFEWKQVLDSVTQTSAWQPEKGIEIAGQVKSLFNKPIKNGAVTLISAHKGPIFTSTTDDNGMFRFSDLIFADTARFVLSAVNASNKNSTKISWFGDNGSAPQVQKNVSRLASKVTDTAIATYLANAKVRQQEDFAYDKSKGILLKQVNIHEKKPDNQYRTFSLAGAGNADQVMHADEIEKINGPLGTSLDGRLHGVNFVGMPLHRVPVLGYGGQPMLVIIDGQEGGNLNYLNADDVETIEVLKYSSTAIYGMEGGHGVLIVTTKQTRGLAAKDIASIGVLPIAPMGFYKAREFYSPKYDNSSWVGKQTDLRSTIYWKPEITTDKNGNASFEYYNADGAGTYKVIVEGIDKDGNIGRQVYRYKVE